MRLRDKGVLKAFLIVIRPIYFQLSTVSPMDVIQFFHDVRAIVRQIPPGKVLTYGRVATLAGWPHHARLVGRVMSLTKDASVPYHRVVNAAGRTAPGWPGQIRSLREEGVALKSSLRRDGTAMVDLRQSLWKIEEDC